MFTNEVAHESLNPALDGHRLNTGEVIQVGNGRAVVSLGVQQVNAEVAVLDYDPAPGDRVLLIGDLQSSYFLIGVLSTAQPRPKFRVDPSGTTTLEVEQGNLQLSAPRGKVRVTSGTGAEVISAGPIDLRSGTAVRFSVISCLGNALSFLGLTRDRTELSNSRVDVTTNEFCIDAARGSAKIAELSSEVESANLKVSRLLLGVETLQTTIGNAYQKVTGLWQLTAERTRMVVRGTSHHKAKRIYSKAEDVKVKADKIHLG